MMKGIHAAKLVGAAVGALLVSGSVVAITAYAAGVQMPQFAASPTPTKPGTAAGQQYCQTYLGHLAKDLGSNKSQADIQKAAKQAFDQTVDDAVNAGQLTKDQGAALKAKVTADQVCAGQLAAIGRGFAQKGGAELGMEAVKSEATVLGTTPADLMAQVKAGKTVKDLAAAKGFNDEAAFRAAYVAQIKKDLAPLVSSGKLTQAQADAVAKRAETAPIPFWNGAPKHASKPRTATG
jgi:hypothetical protein